MDATDVEPNTITFSSLITAYTNALPGRPDKALEVLHRMKERGIEADTISYNTVVKAYSNTGKPSFFELMQERNVQPNIITWNSLLHAANHDRRQGVLEEA